MLRSRIVMGSGGRKTFASILSRNRTFLTLAVS
jgi:hypothetical protein